MQERVRRKGCEPALTRSVEEREKERGRERERERDVVCSDRSCRKLLSACLRGFL